VNGPWVRNIGCLAPNALNRDDAGKRFPIQVIKSKSACVTDVVFALAFLKQVFKFTNYLKMRTTALLKLLSFSESV
jgi:hypothetical protein